MAIRILYFSQDGCMACSEQEPILLEVEKNCGVKVERIAIDPTKGRSLIKEYRLSVTPTILFVRERKELERFEGLVHQEQLSEAIRRHL